MSETFQKFGKNFQIKLAQLLICDFQFCAQIEEILEYDFFELKYLQSFVGLLFDYKDKYRQHPTWEAMETLIRTELENETPTLRVQVEQFYEAIDCEAPLLDEAFIKEKTVDFCRKQKLKRAILRSVELMSTPTSYDQIRREIDEALRLGDDNNRGHEYLADFEDRYKPDLRYRVTTGWTWLDEIMHGGLAQKQSGIIIAPSGGGKSMILTHLGAAAAKNGYNVVHVTLELEATDVGRRYDSCITGVTLDELDGMKDFVKEEISKVPGRLFIKEYPMNSITCNTIRNYLYKLHLDGLKADLVLVDYGDLMKPEDKKKEGRFALQAAFEDLKRLAQELEVPVWTATQTNRGGLDQEIITMSSIAESFGKIWASDFVMTVSRTIEDKTSQGGRFFLAKNRNGADGLVREIFMDTSRVKIEILEQEIAVEDLLNSAPERRLQRESNNHDKQRQYAEKLKQRVELA